MASTSRLSPMKVQSIVSLEICGAVLGKRLAKSIQNETRFEIKKKYFIVDSEIVRSIIQKESYGFNTFIAVRVGEIQECTDPSEWFWIEGELNVADWITRAKEDSDINFKSIWQEGPSYLRNDEAKWLVKGSVTEELPEIKAKKFVYHIDKENYLTNIIDKI